MKRKILITLIVILIVILLIPSKQYADDGGSVYYRAITYSVTDYHQMMKGGNEYKVGYTVDILGFTVFDNTHIVKE